MEGKNRTMQNSQIVFCPHVKNKRNTIFGQNIKRLTNKFLICPPMLIFPALKLKTDVERRVKFPMSEKKRCFSWTRSLKSSIIKF